MRNKKSLQPAAGDVYGHANLMFYRRMVSYGGPLPPQPSATKMARLALESSPPPPPLQEGGIPRGHQLTRRFKQAS